MGKFVFPLIVICFLDLYVLLFVFSHFCLCVPIAQHYTVTIVLSNCWKLCEEKEKDAILNTCLVKDRRYWIAKLDWFCWKSKLLTNTDLWATKLSINFFPSKCAIIWEKQANFKQIALIYLYKYKKQLTDSTLILPIYHQQHFSSNGFEHPSFIDFTDYYL